MLILAICLIAGLVFCLAWRYVAVRRSRTRAVEILRWIESALEGQGHVVGIRWLAPSRFKVPLRLTCGVFQRAWMLVEMVPSEMPLRWLIAHVRNRGEIATFQADLDLPPAFSLEVHNYRWFARSNRKSSADNGHWVFEQSPPFVITTKHRWQREISCAMSSLANGNREFLTIQFGRKSPHFSAQLPLETLAPESPTRSIVFDSIREMAANSSASLS